jgi:hypothetical protein
MADDKTNDDTRAELERVEAQIAEIRREVRDLRDGLSDAGAMDPEDRSAVLSQAEEQEAVAAELERRRDTLRERLGSA